MDPPAKPVRHKIILKIKMNKQNAIIKKCEVECQGQVRAHYKFISHNDWQHKGMYQINTCSPIWNSTPASGFDVRIVRLLLLTVLFLLYILYMIIHLILRKTVRNLKSEDSGPRLSQKQLYMQNWQREYMLCFGDHIVAVGFVMCFSPYQLQIILSILYLVLRVVYEVRLLKYGHTVKIIKTILRIINLSLLICAIVGLSRTEWDVRLGACRDFDYRILMPM